MTTKHQNKKFNDIFNALKEPIRKTREENKNIFLHIKIFFRILREVLSEGHQISGPFLFLMFSLSALLYVGFPSTPVLVLIFLGFVVSYMVFFINMIGKNVSEFFREQLAPFNEFVYNEINSRVEVSNNDINKLAKDLSKEFSSSYLEEFNQYLLEDFKKFDERISTIITFSALIITTFTILNATADSFKETPSFLLLVFSILIFNIFTIAIKVNRKLKYDKVFSALKQSIKLSASKEDKLNNQGIDLKSIKQ